MCMLIKSEKLVSDDALALPKSSPFRQQDTHERSVKTLPCVSFSLSFIRFKGFLCPFFFLMECGCRFLPTRYLT